MELFSKEYGWTPNQIKELTPKELNDYLDIIYTRNKIINNKSKSRK